VRFNFRGADVVEVLECVGRQVGFPKAIRVDQGSEFVSRDLDLWAYQLHREPGQRHPLRDVGQGGQQEHADGCFCSHQADEKATERAVAICSTSETRHQPAKLQCR
jgi:hypothetical protein